MIKRIGKINVDVCSSTCGPVPQCYFLGFDNGTFVQGRGYTRYHDRERPVCWTRHRNGCPATYRCVPCGLVYGPYAISGTCARCNGHLLALS